VVFYREVRGADESGLTFGTWQEEMGFTAEGDEVLTQTAPSAETGGWGAWVHSEAGRFRPYHLDSLAVF